MTANIKFGIYQKGGLIFICVFVILILGAGFIFINNSASNSGRKIKSGAEKVSEKLQKIKESSEKMRTGINNITGNGHDELLDSANRLISEIDEAQLIVSDSAIKDAEMIPLYHILINIITIAVILLFVFLASKLFIHNLSPYLNSIADKIIKTNITPKANNEESEKPNVVQISDVSIDIKELLKKTEHLITEYLKAMSEIKKTVSNLTKTTENNAEVLNFLSAKAGEHSLAAEKDLISIKNISEITAEIVDGADEQHASLGLLVLRMLDFTKIIEAISGELTSQINVIDNISLKFEDGNKYLKLMNESMTRIDESSAKMSESLKFITEISDRINLLSLNAAIESARAGEHGRGFAVVSDEISKLADQTASSINEINDLIKINEGEIKNGLLNVEKTVQTIYSAVEGVVSIKEIMHAAYGKMDFQIKNNYIVNEESEKVREGTSAINNAISKQKKAIDELVVSINDIKEMSQYFSYLTQQVVKHAAEISDWIVLINKAINLC